METVEVVVLSNECYHCDADCRGGGDIDGKVLVGSTAEFGVGRKEDVGSLSHYQKLALFACELNNTSVRELFSFH